MEIKTSLPLNAYTSNCVLVIMRKTLRTKNMILNTNSLKLLFSGY